MPGTTRIIVTVMTVASIAGCVGEDTVAEAPVNGADAVASGEEQREDPSMVDGRWNGDVCDHADFVRDRTDDDRLLAWSPTATLLRACDQVRAGVDPDRPDVVECYGRADEPGGTIAGEIATETCEVLADGERVPVAHVETLTR